MINIAFLAADGVAPPPAPPAAIATPQPAAAPADDLLKAEVLMDRGNGAEAKAILAELEKSPSGVRARDNQVQFLLGLIAVQEKNYDEAITRYRRVLVADPKAVRVRLEMGRAYFLMDRYTDAERQFLYARAGDLPKAVLANVDMYLAAIRQRKTISYGLSFAIAPSSNLNAGPSTDTVSLYGLPFQLSPDAKAKSGVGLTLDANGEWAPRVGEQTKWRVGAQLHRAQFSKGEFDDMTVASYTGPHVTLKQWDLNAQVNASRRWYGDSGYAASWGPSADATYLINPRLGVGASISLAHITYDLNALQSGTGELHGLNFIYTPTPASFMRGVVAFGRQDARTPAFAYDSRLMTFSYVREFGGGLTLSVAPTVTAIDYDAALAAFPAPRRDRQYALQLTALDRRIDFHGLTPRVSYVFTSNDSNLSLYKFNRQVLEMGITSAF